MNVRHTFRAFFSRFGSLNSQGSSINPVAKSFATRWLTGRDETLSGPGVLSNAFQQSTWVYACVTTLA